MVDITAADGLATQGTNRSHGIDLVLSEYSSHSTKRNNESLATVPGSYIDPDLFPMHGETLPGYVMMNPDENPSHIPNRLVARLIPGRWGISVRRYFRDFFLFMCQFYALVFHRMKSNSN